MLDCHAEISDGAQSMSTEQGAHIIMEELGNKNRY